jgi:hypothetical protein
VLSEHRIRIIRLFALARDHHQTSTIIKQPPSTDKPSPPLTIVAPSAQEELETNKYNKSKSLITRPTITTF